LTNVFNASLPFVAGVTVEKAIITLALEIGLAVLEQEQLGAHQ
jgi:hypothetical protein